MNAKAQSPTLCVPQRMGHPDSPFCAGVNTTSGIIAARQVEIKRFAKGEPPANSTGFTFNTVEGMHFFDGILDFRVSQASGNSISFTITAQGNWSSVLSLPFRPLILSQENAAWTNLVGQMRKACGN
jgi:hypothetical protein